MWVLRYSAPQKAGVILYGLLIGVLMLPLTAFVCLVLGICIVIVEHSIGIHAGGGWILVGCVWYGLYLGVPVGLIVCWKICRSRLCEATPNESVIHGND